MSPQDSASKQAAGPHRAPRTDVYTILLVIALIALLLGVFCLYREMDMYEWKISGGPTAAAQLGTDSVALAGGFKFQNPTSSTDAPATFQLLPLRSGG